jgi:DNA repair exonuclease SbcCD ATPase subunit
MKFQNLTISNFGSIGDIELPLADQGLTLILGRNEDAPKADSNGAGKSLPLDAFTWALWGNTVRGFGSDEVVHNKVNKNCKVGVSLSDRGHDYEVVRLRRNKEDTDHKPNDLILRCDGVEVSGASVADTQTMIEEILGLDFITFCAMMPGAGITVATMTDAEVKSLLEKLLRTEALGRASEEARKRSRAASEELVVHCSRMTDMLISVSEVKTRLVDLETKEEDYANTRQEKIEELDVAIAAVETVKGQNSLIALQEDAIRLRNSEITVLAEGALANQSRLVLDFNKIKKHYDEKLTKLNEDKVGLGVRFEGIDLDMNTLDGFAGQCPACHQVVSEDHALELRTALKEKERLLKIKLSTIEASGKATRERKEAGLQETLDLLREADVALADLHTQEAEASIALVEAMDAAAVVGWQDTRIAELTSRKTELESDDNPYLSLVESEEVILINKQQELDKLETQIVDLRRTSEILSFWVDSFSPQGIRSFMLEHVTPLLNQFAKKYADLITSGEMEITFHTKDTLKSGKSKERFNIKVSQKHGGGSYASNSSGERARANLIIALALGELAALRADKQIPFRFLDEPFESIDEAGTESIVTLLNQQKDQYNSVYVITHQDHFKQLFPNKKTIVKKGGFSSLEEE